LASILSPELFIRSDRYPEIGAVEFFLDNDLVGKHIVRLIWWQQLVVARGGIAEPSKVWRPRETEKLAHRAFFAIHFGWHHSGIS
jgi:hypothetical protein